jgi:hypothetical protein
MNHRIGHVAGKVWRTLGEKGQVPVNQLIDAIDDDQDLVTMALGWLARENKVVFHETNTNRHATVMVALTPEERRIFESTRNTAAASSR